jgi:hypothetical protein
MRIRVLLSLLIASLAILIIYYSVDDKEIIHCFYAKNIRNSLFTGFLTMGSFLLSLKAFIVVKLKENVYDSAAYKGKLKEFQLLNPKLTLYGPLKRLSLMIFLSIVSAITASVLQLSLGLISHWVASVICIFSAVFSISMLVSSLLIIKKTLDDWLDYLEEANTGI